MPTVSFQINNKCSGIVRVPGIQIETIEGRLTGNNITFNKFSYFDMQMRRKGEILQYKNGSANTTFNTKKQNYSQVIKTIKNSYSQAFINHIISKRTTNEDTCPIILTSASNSGVRGDYKTLLYNDINVPLTKNNTI
jgi:hypothetical protein